MGMQIYICTPTNPSCLRTNLPNKQPLQTSLQPANLLALHTHILLPMLQTLQTHNMTT